MEVILLERIDQLGQMGDIVKVKSGFARNYLLPKKKALRETKESREYFESKRAELEANNLKRRGEAESAAKKMDGTKIVIVRQAGEGGQLYGSVTARNIGDALKDAGFAVDRGQVLLHTPIKTLGTFTTTVRLHSEVKIKIECTVARSLEEAKMAEQKATEFLERQEDAEKLSAIDDNQGTANDSSDESEVKPALDSENKANA